ncbi:OmpA family protein [Nitrogeniibacter mangrovi]|uniref:OmpA family protein n=1 Tax=Nitrogeniibacter mangrovi TaxID=2016596 RepID=A0A6C1B1Y9_9RHOO|nr:OmpA family protein [Nitrogeniibacter mangrovi]QID17383.1 OmpA family protein [Nitrogeniibacter mangrovi]
MIKQMKKQLTMAAAAAVLGFTAMASIAADDIVVTGKGDVPYVIDGRNVVTRSGYDLCWRTGSWTPAAAANVMAGEFPVGCGCDGDLMPKDACTAKMAAAPEAKPMPAPAPKPSAEKVKLAADALFDFDKAVLKPEGKTKLDRLAAQAEALKLEVILAVGHTDRLGSAAYNQKLSEKRAAAVKEYLVGKGIEANRIYTEGKGETQPVTTDNCKNSLGRKKLIECLQPDRRVEIEVIGSK